jgi:hypothetical protein
MQLPDVQVSGPQELPPATSKRRKHLAIVPPPSDVLLLQTRLDGAVSSRSSASSGLSPRPPPSPSSSGAGAEEKRLRRSSTRSLELLRNAQEQGQLPNWDSLPPSPMFADTPLNRGFVQWGTEAAAAPEKEQRARIAKELVRVSRRQDEKLVLKDALLVTELPVGLGQMLHLKRVELHHVGIKTLPDLSELVHLEVLIISHCPHLRTLPHGLSQRAARLQVELYELPQLRDASRRLVGAEVVRWGRPWDALPQEAKGGGRRQGPRLLHNWL